MPTIYHATWILPTSRASLRDQFNETAAVADECGLELLSISFWKRNTVYVATFSGDLHGVFSFLCRVGYPAAKMTSTEVER